MNTSKPSTTAHSTTAHTTPGTSDSGRLLDKPPGRRLVLGTPDRVRAEVEQVAADYHADEVIVVSITYDHEARKRSYELIAEAFGLGPSEPLAA